MRTLNRFLGIILMSIVVFTGCKYDDDDIWDKVNNLEDRVAALEEWSKTVNNNISSLQALLDAQQNSDFITGVTPILQEGVEIGYSISFMKSSPISIYHGTDGLDGDTPVVGVRKDTDDKYYWTVDGEWLLDGKDKIPASTDVIENEGTVVIAPQIRINKATNYWETSTDGGEIWTSTGVKATGDKGATGSAGAKGDRGDAIFAKDGIDYISDPANVTFTLADGTTQITLPRTSGVTVAFDSYETFYVSLLENEITLILPATLEEEDYTAIIATVMNSEGTGVDIQTRSEATVNVWGVEVIKPTFSGGVVDAGSAKVKLTPPTGASDEDKAILKVTILNSYGQEYSVSRPVEFFDGIVIDKVDGSVEDQLSGLSVANIKKISVVGAMNTADFTYIKENLTSLEVLDISGTDLIEIPAQALVYHKSIKTVVLPATIEVIKEYSFYDCSNLTTINIPATVHTIEDYAFMNTALTSVTLPAAFRTLGEWVFYGSADLKTITLNEGLTTLPESAFSGCAVETINIPSTLTELPKWAFSGCDKLENITLTNGLEVIGVAAFYGCSSLTSVNIPETVHTIGEYAFQECEKLTTVNIPALVTVLNDGLFLDCWALANFSWHNGITSIGNDVFSICRSFPKTVVIPTSVTTIGMRAFTYTGITSLTLPEGLTSIAESAFNECSIKDIELPSTIESVHATAFYWLEAETVTCNSLTPPDMPLIDVDNNSFDMFFQIKGKEGERDVCVLYVPDGSEAAYDSWKPYFKAINPL